MKRKQNQYFDSGGKHNDREIHKSTLSQVNERVPFINCPPFHWKEQGWGLGSSQMYTTGSYCNLDLLILCDEQTWTFHRICGLQKDK